MKIKITSDRCFLFLVGYLLFMMNVSVLIITLLITPWFLFCLPFTIGVFGSWILDKGVQRAWDSE